MRTTHDAQFIRPTALLYELAILSEIGSGYAIEAATPFASVDEGARHAFWANLLERGLIEVMFDSRGGPTYRITTAGEQRLTHLLVDFLRELHGLADVAATHFRRRFAAMYVEGVRRVAFYPIGETAQAAVLELARTGLTLVAAIDDDDRRWGEPFGGIRIAGRDALAAAAPDAVVITTPVFQDAIRRRIEEAGVAGLRVHSL
jgi:hypothetical protein